ncbi:MAG: hypothetical protein ACR2I7_06700 [Geodermatophilaceae bacterium]
MDRGRRRQRRHPGRRAGRHLYNRALTNLIGELATPQRGLPHPLGRAHIRLHHTGVKRFRYGGRPPQRRLTTRALTADPGLTLAVYPAEPGSPTVEG